MPTQATPLKTLSEAQVREWISNHVPLDDFQSKKVLLIVPDATRTAPLPLLFSSLHEHLDRVANQLDVLVALGTHDALNDDAMRQLLGITQQDRDTKYKQTGMYNHEWNNPNRLTILGALSQEQTARISGGRLSLDVPVQINSRIADYDVLLIAGPVFPHEVVGFSGGNKYFFPGISGPELLNFFHWLGALITNVGIIGNKQTAVRQVVDQAAALIPNEKRCLAFVVNPQAEPYGLFYGSPESAWNSAADLSAQVHFEVCDRPYQTVLSCAPPMYDELWTAGKCMYKLEPVVADGGELIIYAPHLSDISRAHGDVIMQIGYHVRDYFTKQWEQYKDYPWGVLAHSTHVRGTGTFENGVESPRVTVTLASQVPESLCKQIALEYRDPATIDVESYANREGEGILLVRKAGEQLYRLKSK